MFDEYIERPSIPIRWAGLFSPQPYFLRFDRPVAVSPGAPTTCVPLHYDRQRGPADLRIHEGPFLSAASRRAPFNGQSQAGEAVMEPRSAGSLSERDNSLGSRYSARIRTGIAPRLYL